MDLTSRRKKREKERKNKKNNNYKEWKTKAEMGTRRGKDKCVMGNH